MLPGPLSPDGVPFTRSRRTRLDDLVLGLADAVREAARPLPPVEPAGPTGVPSRSPGAPGAAVGLERETVRRGHLRSVPTLDD